MPMLWPGLSSRRAKDTRKMPRTTVQRNGYFVVHSIRREMQIGPFDEGRGRYPGPGVASADDDAIASPRQTMQAEQFEGYRSEIMLPEESDIPVALVRASDQRM